MKDYPIAEYFGSMQGEGSLSGSPAFFIRTQGCNVNCPWCDSKETWFESKSDFLSIDFLLKQAENYRHIVITGGEPCLHDLTELTTAFIEIGKTVQIETSGTSKILANRCSWITLSPKLNNPKKLLVLEENMIKASEFKFPIANFGDLEQVREFYKKNKDSMEGHPIWLQPISQCTSATFLCLKEAQFQGWKVSVQIHKFIGIR